MKKTILINHLLEPGNRLSGISNYLFYLLDQLLERNSYNFILVTCWDEEQLPEMLWNRDLSVVTLPYIESTPKNLINQFFLIPRLMKQFNADLEFNPNPLGCFGGKHRRVSVVHDLYFDVKPESYKFHHRLWWKFFFPLSCFRSSKIICVSQNTASDLAKFHPKFKSKTEVVLEAACLKKIEECPVSANQRKSYGLFVANVSPNKGAEVLIKALKLLNDKDVPVEVLHAGKDSEGYLTHFANIHGLSELPKALGRVSDEELRNLYLNARFLVFPSLYEGFGLPVLEAQTFGVPVIASDIPVLREVAGKAGAFFEVDNADALANSIREIISDDELFEVKSKASVENSNLFSWAKAAMETEQLISQTL